MSLSSKEQISKESNDSGPLKLTQLSGIQPPVTLFVNHVFFFPVRISSHICKNLDRLIPPSFQTLVWSSFGSFFGGLIFACNPGSCHSRRTGALWAAGSWSAGWRDPPSSRCSPADAGPTSGYRLLHTTWGVKKTKQNTEKLHIYFH